MKKMLRLQFSSVATIFVVLGLFCLWLQIMLSISSGMYWDGDELMNANDTSEQVLALVPLKFHKYLTVHSRNSTANSTEHIAVKNITEIKRAIKKHNNAQTIYNEDMFGPVQNDTVIIAIQVHLRLTYLRYLIVSLAQARDINRTLLIFSHDYYDDEINNLVRSIDFTKVMQIFYPYSIQTHPHEFPGMDPKDCPRDILPILARDQGCNNALHPDLHGHYREAKYTQTKHHWWWKANRIFNQLQCTIGHTGYVLFLEEDHYVAEDFLHFLSLLKSTADKSCPQCEILALGTYPQAKKKDKLKKNKHLNYTQAVEVLKEEKTKKQENLSTWNFTEYQHRLQYTAPQKVVITPWRSNIHNMGFAFNITVWSHIMKHQHQFCAYDDYNWDYSLFHLSQNMPGREKFKVIVCKEPRVFHIGKCGFHHKKWNCNASTVISKVQKLLQKAKPYMFPARVTATVNSGDIKPKKKVEKGNGGWGDIRDQELCANMTKIGRQPRHSIYYA